MRAIALAILIASVASETDTEKSEAMQYVFGLAVAIDLCLIILGL
jgi:2-keto-4-pentenoate hydratase/2-oxohepta-3-ene-1,7-dioic acid hydratase in catechol pathway